VPDAILNTKLLLIGLALLALSAVPAVLEYREARRGGSDALEMQTIPADFSAPFETRMISFQNPELVCKIRASAPVDNSWMLVAVTALDEAGREVASRAFSISYYHGVKAGRAWHTGGRQASTSLILPVPGNYRMRFAITAGAGANAEPDTASVARPMRLTLKRSSLGASRVRVVSFVVLAILGGAFVLRSLASIASPAHAAPGPGNDASSSGSRLRPVSGARMVFLDGLRGIACFSVLLCHLFVPEISATAASLKSVMPEIIPALLRHGDLGVEIFFVLSGFVIAYSLRRHQITGSLAWRFALRRSLRLDPPYHFTLLLAIGVWGLVLTDSFYGIGEKFEGVPGLLANAAYLQDLLRYPALFSVAWTLCLEIQFYLAFVFLAWIARGIGALLPQRFTLNVPWLASLIVFMPVGIFSVAMWYSGLASFTFPGTWFRFFLGVITFWAIDGRVPRLVFYGFAAMLFLISIVTGDLRGGIAGFTAAVIFIAGIRGHLTRWLSGRVWQYLGRISYSLYLLHIVIAIPFINWIWILVPQSTAVALALFPAAIGVSLLSAHLFHVYFERPSLTLSRLVHY
jgi:peptidoglycan/LPS O-acetylase OafA/YrhL